MKIKSLLVTVVAGIALAGCVETAEFGGSGGSFGGSGGSFGGSGGSGGSGGFGGSGGSFGGAGGSSNAGERLARQVCTAAIRDEGRQVVEIYRTRSLDYPYRGAGIDLYISSRRDPMTVNLSYTRCRFMYDTGRATLASLKRP